MLSLTTPRKPKFIQQNNGSANFEFSGYTDSDVTITLEPIQYGEKTIVEVKKIVATNEFQSSFRLKAGDYVCTIKNMTDTITINPICVGEVLILTGHSFTDGYGALPDANKSAYFSNNFFAKNNPSAFSDEVDVLNYRTFSNNQRTAGLAGRLASKIVEKIKMPVFLFHCNWGGTNLRHWGDSSKGINVTEYAGYQPGYELKGYPYGILRETIVNYLPQTGCRGVLILHGDNDRDTQSRQDIFNSFKNLLSSIRKDAKGIITNGENLGVSYAKSVFDLSFTNVTGAYDDIIANGGTKVFTGVDTTPLFLNASDRYDIMHPNDQGNDKLAESWANILVQNGFFGNPSTGGGYIPTKAVAKLQIEEATALKSVDSTEIGIIGGGIAFLLLLLLAITLKKSN